MSSVVVRSADQGAIERAVESYVQWLGRERPEVKKLIWFGSWVSGIPVPGSDVDMCLILTASASPVRDRIPRYLPDRFPVGMDLFPYTEVEFNRLQQDNPPWYREITSGRTYIVKS